MLNTSVDKIGQDLQEPTVTEQDINEYQGESDFNLTDYREVAVTEQEGVYGSNCTLNGEVVETLTGEDIKGILSVSEEGNGKGQLSTDTVDEKFAAWDMPYAVTAEGYLQPREGQSTDTVYQSPFANDPIDRID